MKKKVNTLTKKATDSQIRNNVLLFIDCIDFCKLCKILSVAMGCKVPEPTCLEEKVCLIEILLGRKK